MLIHNNMNKFFLDELSSEVRHSRRVTKGSSPRRIIRLVPVFILETHNQTNYECCLKFVQTDNASSSIKTAIFNEPPIVSYRKEKSLKDVLVCAELPSITPQS